ncbi:MAG: NADH-quinone oxidoreductase subunit C [bacterium]
MLSLEEIFQSCASLFGEKISRLPVFRGEEAWRADVSVIGDLLTALKREHGFDFLVNINGVDNLGKKPRFELVYELRRLADKTRLRVKTAVEEKNCIAPSVSKIWRAADWHEREVYDMMGIVFSGHPDLRRILMWEGYPHFPLRKDFPLEGIPSEMPDVAFSHQAPLAGGPFVTQSAASATEREPRAKPSTS